VDNAVTDGISHRRFADFMIPALRRELRAANYGITLMAGVDDVENIPCIGIADGGKQPLVENKEFCLLVLPDYGRFRGFKLCFINEGLS